jgi:hypothetical protein
MTLKTILSGVLKGKPQSLPIDTHRQLQLKCAETDTIIDDLKAELNSLRNQTSDPAK